MDVFEILNIIYGVYSNSNCIICSVSSNNNRETYICNDCSFFFIAK